MPAKNSIKISVENGFYHIYNRGANKQDIFEDRQDYAVFLNYLKEALSLPLENRELETFEININGTVFVKPKRKPKNFCVDITLIAYVLMPNHFHLIIKQNIKNSMQSFMRSVATRYSMYFNKKHDRTGTLFQGIYKAVMIMDENYLLNLSRYIHLNPKENFIDLTKAYSSYSDYLGLTHRIWLDPSPVLNYFNKPTNLNFKKTLSYKKFVEEYKLDKQSEILLEDFTME